MGQLVAAISYDQASDLTVDESASLLLNLFSTVIGDRRGGEGDRRYRG